MATPVLELIVGLEKIVSTLSVIAHEHGARQSAIDLNPVVVTETGGLMIADASAFPRSG